LRTTAKTWHLLPHDRGAIERLARELHISPIAAQLLLNRGLAEPAQARRFLDAPLDGLHAPERLPGAAEAAGRLLAAVRAGRRLCVYGDYDTDGITGTAILWRLLRQLGAAADFYVPNRLEEGYGLHHDALRRIARSGASLVVTVDCGIGSPEEAEEARRLGLELIITDHHEPKERLPEAAVLVHPRLPGGGYPFGGLSGAGVAFKVAWALCKLACGSEKVTPELREFLLDAVSLTAVGLVADVVPLHDENRIFVRHGLRRLRQQPSVGLKALIEAAGLADRPRLSADDISFKLAPRLNAAGRLGCARLVVELLTTPSAARAQDLVRFLESQNEQRQLIERRILRHARELIGESDLDGAPALVLASEEWHPGIIGIVAGRLVDLYARPALLIALSRWRRALDQAETADDGALLGQGSGRSIPDFPLHEALSACSEHLLSHGGHAAAAGFKIRPEQIDSFRERFCAYARHFFPQGPPPPRLVVDAEVPLALLTPGLMSEIARLEPYGAANRRPLLLAGGLQLVGEPRCLGMGERHLSFRVRQENAVLRAVGFHMAERRDELLAAGGRCCLVFTPRLNTWQGLRRIELEVIDFQAGATARLQ
jgi:single-stranded-DNA-specific exonuclease